MGIRTTSRSRRRVCVCAPRVLRAAAGRRLGSGSRLDERHVPERREAHRPRRLAQGDVVRVGETDLKGPMSVARLRASFFRDRRDPSPLRSPRGPRRTRRETSRSSLCPFPTLIGRRPPDELSGPRRCSHRSRSQAPSQRGRLRRQAPALRGRRRMGGAQAGEVPRGSSCGAEGERRGPRGRAADCRPDPGGRSGAYDRSNRDPSASGMGTTMTVALVENGQVAFGHVGDSRAYLIRAGAMEQLTDDHSLVAELDAERKALARGNGEPSAALRDHARPPHRSRRGRRHVQQYETRRVEEEERVLLDMKEIASDYFN